MLFSFSARPRQQSAAACSALLSQDKMLWPRLRTVLLGAAAVAGSITPALAQPGPSVKARQPDATSLWLTIENPAQQILRLVVVRLDNQDCLASVVSHQPSHGHKLNFEGLPAGQYAVLMQVGSQHFRYNVQVKNRHQSHTIEVEGLGLPNTAVL